jgi:hypothetical protein
MASYMGGVEIVVEGAVIETARAKLETHPPSPTGRIDWGGSLWPSGGRPVFTTAFLNLQGVFAIRVRGDKAQVMKRATLTRPGTQQCVEIVQADGGLPF